MAKVSQKVFGMARNVFIKKNAHGTLRFRKGNEFTIFKLFGREMKSSPNMDISQLREIFPGSNFRGSDSTLEQFKNLPDHYSRARKTRLSVADILTYFNKLIKRLMSKRTHPHKLSILFPQQVVNIPNWQHLILTLGPWLIVSGLAMSCFAFSGTHIPHISGLGVAGVMLSVNIDIQQVYRNLISILTSLLNKKAAAQGLVSSALHGNDLEFTSEKAQSILADLDSEDEEIYKSAYALANQYVTRLNNIKGIMLDFGGVLANLNLTADERENNFERFFNELNFEQHISGTDRNEKMATLKNIYKQFKQEHRDYYIKNRRGLIYFDDYVDILNNYLKERNINIKLSSRDFAFLFMHPSFKGEARFKDILRGLKSKYNFYILSDQHSPGSNWSEPEAVDRTLEEYYPGIFDKENIFRSYKTGYSKHYPEAFSGALEKIGLTAEEVVFIDDIDEFTFKARELGILTSTVNGDDPKLQENFLLNELLHGQWRKSVTEKVANRIIAGVHAVYDTIAPAYAQTWQSDPAITEYINTFLTRLPENGVILDAGTGAGRDAAWLRNNGRDAIGIDLSLGQLIEARKQHSEPPLIQMDLRYLAFKSGTMAGVWDNATFHHLPSTLAPQVLEEYRRALRDDGLLFIRIKRGDTEGYEYDPSYKLYRYFKRYQESELRELVSAHGFEVIKSGEQTTSKDEWVYVFARPTSRGIKPLLTEEASPNANVEPMSADSSVNWQVDVDVSQLLNGHPAADIKNFNSKYPAGSVQVNKQPVLQFLRHFDMFARLKLNVERIRPFVKSNIHKSSSLFKPVGRYYQNISVNFLIDNFKRVLFYGFLRYVSPTEGFTDFFRKLDGRFNPVHQNIPLLQPEFSVLGVNQPHNFNFIWSNLKLQHIVVWRYFLPLLIITGLALIAQALGYHMPAHPHVQQLGFTIHGKLTYFTAGAAWLLGPIVFGLARSKKLRGLKKTKALKGKGIKALGQLRDIYIGVTDNLDDLSQVVVYQSKANELVNVIKETELDSMVSDLINPLIFTKMTLELAHERGLRADEKDKELTTIRQHINRLNMIINRLEWWPDNLPLPIAIIGNTPLLNWHALYTEESLLQEIKNTLADSHELELLLTDLQKLATSLHAGWGTGISLVELQDLIDTLISRGAITIESDFSIYINRVSGHVKIYRIKQQTKKQSELPNELKGKPASILGRKFWKQAPVLEQVFGLPLLIMAARPILKKTAQFLVKLGLADESLLEAANNLKKTDKASLRIGAAGSLALISWLAAAMVFGVWWLWPLGVGIWMASAGYVFQRAHDRYAELVRGTRGWNTFYVNKGDRMITQFFNRDKGYPSPSLPTRATIKSIFPTSNLPKRCSLQLDVRGGGGPAGRFASSETAEA